MGNFDLHGLINAIANNHGVASPVKSAKRKMRDVSEGDGQATAQAEGDATSATSDASMQLAQADTGVATEAAAGETTGGASGAPAAGEAAAGSGAAAGGLGGLGLGGMALGGAALAGGGGGGGSAVAAAVNNIITGTVVAGPVLAGSGLKVEIYAANGTTKLGESTLDASGKFTVDVGAYTGIVIARLVDANGGDDYLDEATGVPKDLNANLMATSVVTGGTFTLNINPLTTIAAQKAGLAADGSGGLADAAAVANANAAVAAAFGLTDLTGTSVVATNGGSYDAADGMSAGEKYGAILAALSGADFASSGDSQAIIDNLVAAIDITGASGTLSAAGQSAVIAGAAVVDSDFIDDVLNTVRAGATAPPAPTINAVAADNIINADEVESVITGTNETGATVDLGIGGNTRAATVSGTTWSYTLTDADLTAMGQGAETLSATQTDVLGNTGSAGTRAISVDTVAPVFSSATVSGRTLVLTYNEALDATSMPLPSAFRVGGIAQGAPVAGVVDSAAKTLTLTLASPVTYGQTGITVSYTDPTEDNDLAAIQDLAGNDASTLTNLAVTNNTPDAPLYQSATVTGSTLVMTYAGDLDENNLPPLDAFTVKVNNTAQAAPTGVVVDADAGTVTLTLAAPVIHGQTVTVGYTDPSAANDLNAIQDSGLNDAVSIGNRVVANQTPDAAAPVFANAVVTENGKYLVLNCDEALDAAHVPPAGAFIVKVGGVAQATPTGLTVNASAKTVMLTLATPITFGQTGITVSYTDPSAANDINAIQDAVGNDAASVTDLPVTNNAADTPILESATVHGDTLVLTYNDALDAGNVPLPEAFAVKVGGADPVAPTNVAVDSAARTVTLTLADAVTSGQTVKLSYTDPTTDNDADAIQDVAGNDAFTVENQSVTNETPPVFSAATVTGSTLVMNYSDALDAAHVPPANAFTIEVNGTPQAAPSAVAVDAAARTVTLTLAAAVTNGQAVTVSYADPTAGNDAAAIQNAIGSDAVSLSNQPVSNHTPPLLSGATVSGDTLVLTYSNELDESNIPLVNAFTVKVNGVAQAAPTDVVVDAAARTVTLTLATAVTDGQAVTVSYVDPSTGDDTEAIQDALGNDAISVANRPVTNTTADVAAPVFSGATVSGDTLVLSYSEALDAANAPVAGDFIVNVDGTAQADPTAVVVDATARTVTLTLAAAVAYGEAVTVTYTDPTVGDDATAIQDTAGNDAVTLTEQSVTNTSVNALAPTLSVVVSAGADVNAIVLTVTTGLNGAASADLIFDGLPGGAVVRNSAAVDVTAGVVNFDGSDTFTVEFPEDSDIHQNLLVTVTGKDAGGDPLGDNVHTIDLVYDVASSTEDLNFASANQNMWGNFNGYIGWHEYIPLLGDAPIVWNEATGEWDDAANPDYWRSGEFSVIDVDLDSSQVIEAAAIAASSVLDTAKAVFDVAAVAVDTVAKGIFDTAKAVFQTAENLYYFGARTVDAAVQATFQAAKGAYDVAHGLYDSASYLFHTVATGLHDAAWNAYASYDNWYHSLDGWGQFWNAAGHVANDIAWGIADVAYNVAVPIWDAAKYAFETTATGIYNTALAVYNAAAGVANSAAQVVFDGAKAVFATAEHVYNEVKQDIYDVAQGVYDLARDGVMAVLATINDKVEFDTALKVDSEVFAQVGLQVDFELDMGSVDADIDYQLTSATQYNKAADMLTITPTMTNMTTGDAVAFDTISPNAKFYAALLYDVGADFDVFIDGKLVVDNTTVYDLSPTSDGLAIQFPISTESFADSLSEMTGGDIEVGKMVLIDLDTTQLEPFEVPFVEALTQDILSIEIAIPTLETEGKAATYVPATADIWTTGTFEEQIGPFPYASVDFSEISSAFFNIINAKFDFSEEFMDQYGLDSLGDAATLAETVQDIATGLMANIWDTLDGEAEGVPIFVLDMTDETASSLLHLNLFTDDVMGNTTSANTGSLGFYAAYGESDPVVAVTVDLDAAYVAIVKAIAKAAASAVTAGAATTIHPVIDAIPSPYNLEFGVEQVLEIAAVPQATIDQITQWLNLGFTFEAADLDVTQAVNFSQDFTLSIDDMSYLVTLEDNTTHAFTANGTGALQISNAGSHDANHDGLITYTLDIVPTAMFSNDTEVGLSLGYQLDFLKGGFSAGAQLPLGELLGLTDADWLNIDFSAIDISMGPLLRVQGELDTLDVDVFESRFALDVGSASYAGAIDIGLVNHSVMV
ncbi:SwmB domain-containing protein [Sulfuritalea hydrogenivorans]|uniref:Uncharacterized protein n=1 Tax=Sulfuritalea hydrogenivorans sk43H TaxID=1223802 RepID=W0SGT8_9PROT|nr:SwmB domain-containing protein [Sulfuritalea hydrogenivorans]BAO30157.1 hypothetical protein SUTH_02369 [Sulfuritalea hydrogenivorans sk43H]